MNSKIIIVGSGASAVHFALSALRKEYQVLMLDVGSRKPKIENPDDSFTDLKSNLSDPVKYFLGESYEAVIYPDFESEYYGFPPSKNYVFEKVSRLRYQANGFSPLFSFAQGGLAEVWTGGVYPLNDQELIDFPFTYSDLEPYYDEVADRIGISGARDDLVRFYPFQKNLMPPLDLDLHAKVVLSEYQNRKSYLNKNLRCYFGRSRVATLSQDKGDRRACKYSGRCLWGCLSESLYTPSITLTECKKYLNFKYLPNFYVTHFNVNSKRRITSVVAESLNTKGSWKFDLDKLVLAAGTLSSSKIFMDSVHKKTGEIIKLSGLMDNRQVLIPYVNSRMIGEKYNPESYQYHQLAMGIESVNSKEYIHGQITTLKTAMIHPLIQSTPFDLKTSTYIFRNLHAALGLLNINFHDSRRDDNYLTLEIEGNPSHSVLIINYSPSSIEKVHIKQTIKKVKKALLSLGCLVPPGMIHMRPMGASVHYAGTIPMSSKRIPYTVSKYCQSHDFYNLYIVDGTTFPFLPAKNLTFTLMANAARVADNAF